MSAAKARVSAGIEKAFYSLVDAAGAGQLAAGVDPGQNGQFLTDGHIGQGGQNQTDLAGQRGVGIACGAAALQAKPNMYVGNFLQLQDFGHHLQVIIFMWLLLTFETGIAVYQASEYLSDT